MIHCIVLIVYDITFVCYYMLYIYNYYASPGGFLKINAYRNGWEFCVIIIQVNNFERILTQWFEV